MSGDTPKSRTTAQAANPIIRTLEIAAVFLGLVIYGSFWYVFKRKRLKKLTDATTFVDARGWSDERVKQHCESIDWPLWPSIVYRREPELVSGFPELSKHTPPRTLFEIDPKSQDLIVYFTSFRRDILSYATDHDTAMAFLGSTVEARKYYLGFESRARGYAFLLRPVRVFQPMSDVRWWPSVVLPRPPWYERFWLIRDPSLRASSRAGARGSVVGHFGVRELAEAAGEKFTERFGVATLVAERLHIDRDWVDLPRT
ncbi:MAG: hypothetical protein AAGI53_06190 [Planctomycetota bacterium]